MNHVSANADVWVIHEKNVLLFRQHEGLWHEEMNMPFDAFLGSATALSSFTLTDTRVYLNLGTSNRSDEHQSMYRWACIEYDPLRLVEIPELPAHQYQHHALASARKKVTVIATGNPSHFARSTSMFRVNEIESRHLGKWVREQKSGTRKNIATLEILVNLWRKPGAAYQKLRMAALACTVTTALLLQLHSNQQARIREHQTLQRIQHSVKKAQTNTTPLSLDQWSNQISKFGKGNRANLNALNIHWLGDGHINTSVQLHRERKRVPTGCTLESPTHAMCSTAPLEQ
jgi:hypothetical protein